MEAERISHTRCDKFHRAKHAAGTLLQFGNEAPLTKLGEARTVLFGCRPHKGRPMPTLFVIDER